LQQFDRSRAFSEQRQHAVHLRAWGRPDDLERPETNLAIENPAEGTFRLKGTI